MKKGDVGMAKHFSKKYGKKGWAFNYLWIKDAYQHLMLHPYITASRTSSQNWYAFSGKYPSIVYSWGCG